MPPQDIADEILSRFPGPVVLYPSRRKWLFVLLGCAAFVATSIWALGNNKVLGWAGLIFFGLGMVVAVVAQLPGASSLKLDREVFEIKHLFRHSSIR